MSPLPTKRIGNSSRVGWGLKLKGSLEEGEALKNPFCGGGSQMYVSGTTHLLEEINHQLFYYYLMAIDYYLVVISFS